MVIYGEAHYKHCYEDHITEDPPPLLTYAKRYECFEYVKQLC
jgi:hypothetical protein